MNKLLRLTGWLPVYFASFPLPVRIEWQVIRGNKILCSRRISLEKFNLATSSYGNFSFKIATNWERKLFQAG